MFVQNRTVFARWGLVQIGVRRLPATDCDGLRRTATDCDGQDRIRRKPRSTTLAPGIHPGAFADDPARSKALPPWFPGKAKVKKRSAQAVLKPPHGLARGAA